MPKRKCCYLNGGKADGEPCRKAAEWMLVGKGGLEFVEACTAHVGELLDDSPVTHIYPIEGRCAG